MNQIKAFYMQAMGEEALAKELAEILGAVPVAKATDEMLEQIGAIAKRLGYEISAKEAREYLTPKEDELADDDLDAVAGGKGSTTEIKSYICAVGGQAGVDDGNFGDNAKEIQHVYRA